MPLSNLGGNKVELDILVSRAQNTLNHMKYFVSKNKNLPQNSPIKTVITAT